MQQVIVRMVAVAMMVTLVGVTSPAHADQWTQFRGATGQGHAGGAALPTEWSPRKNVAWKVDVPGVGWSSPVVHGGRAYVTSAIEGGGSVSLAALCLDAKTGKRVWRTDLFKQGDGAPRIHKKNSHASPTPIVHDGRLYVHFGHQGTACLDLDGKVIWRNNELSYPPVHGNGGSPAVVDDLLIFSCDGGRDPFVVALRRESGEVAWRTARDTKPKKPFSFCTPLVIEVDGAKQVVLPGSDAVFAYEPRTGEVIWRVNYPDGYSVVPRPVYAHGLVYVCSGFNKPTLYAIRPDGRGDVTQSHVVWSTNQSAPHTPSVLVVGDELYMVSDGGVASCLDAKTGAEH